MAQRGELDDDDLREVARQAGLDVQRAMRNVERRAHAARIEDDSDLSDDVGASGTPTFFINGRRHHGAYDIDHLSRAVRAAGARAKLAAA